MWTVESKDIEQELGDLGDTMGVRRLVSHVLRPWV